MGDFQEIEMDPVVAREPAKDKPRVEPKASRFDSAQASVVRSALATAQNWFERGAPWRVVANHVSLHFQEAVSLISRSKPSLESAGQLDATYRAMDDYILRVAPPLQGDEADAFRHEFKAIRSVADNLRRVLGMPKLPSKKLGRSASKSNDAYEAEALQASLELVLLEATSTLNQVSVVTDPSPLIIKAAPSLQRDLSYASSMFDAYGGKDKVSRFAPKLSAIGLAVAQLERLINDRTNSKQMRDAFAGVVLKTNALLTGAKLPDTASVELRSSNKRENQNAVERLEITSARSALTSAFTTLNSRISEGAFVFYELAKKQDEPDEASLWADLVKGLLIALVGNAIGPGVANLVGKFTAVGEATLGLVGNAATDSIQSWAGTLVDKAAAETKSDADQHKAALYFKKALVLGADDARKEVEDGFDNRIKDRSISPEEIRDAVARVSAEAQGADKRTFHQAARDFSVMLAQRTLGADSKRGAKKHDKQVTRIGSDYQFGVGWEDGKRNAARGIARVKIHLTPSGQRIDRYELVGLNREMAAAVFHGAGGKLGELGVPIEIEISADQSGHKAMLVVDETRSLRFASPWQLFKEPATQTYTKYATPEKTWAELRNTIIPNTFTESESE